jgi:iron complex transport system substrate-binding protein
MYALGRDDQLVGVTFECDEPASARRDKMVVVGGRDTSGMSPGAIDAYVRDRLAAGQDLYTLHGDALAELAPDLILTQDLCRVCALPAGHVEEALDYLGCTAEVISPPGKCPECRCGQLTPTGSSSARGRAWSTASKPSRPSCIRARL